jgi:Kef-type K+ transport system membrane component KefB/nucleotide-binding universal stress UspA family protein
MNEIELTFGIAILLSAGLLSAKFAQLLRLPSVTGFIVAGLLLGPSFMGFVPMETVGYLEHFTQIALMLIAFGIGEHIELRRLGGVVGDVGYISIVQAVGAFILVMAGTYFTASFIAGDGLLHHDNFILALLLGAVAVATAPAALLHVVREMGAKGPFTSTLMAIVAVDDGIAIMIFGMAMSVAHQLVSPENFSILHAVWECVYEIVFSLGIGVVTGLLIDFVLNKLHNRGEMLTAGLALLLLCGETTRFLQMSPLLAGMAAGFTIINRAERDVRLFRALNAFEPPIYVLFFTLAGLHMDLKALKLAGWIGVVYFVARVIGKYAGSWLGGVMAGSSAIVRNYLGLALIPQAGVAIGLVILISNDPRLAAWSTVITPVVLAGVVLSELLGPLLVRYTIEKAGEGERAEVQSECGGRGFLACRLWLRSPEGISLPPWDGDRFHPASNPSGVVVFGAYHFATVRGLARIATILSHHYHSLPMSVRVLKPSEKENYSQGDHEAMFMPETDEVKSLGYSLKTEMIFDTPASGLVSAVEYNDAQAVVLGYPVGGSLREFQGIVDAVASNILCPLVAVRFAGTFKCDRIVVPFLSLYELDNLLPVVEAMAMTTRPRITFLHLLYFDSSKEEIATSEGVLQEWLDDNFFDIQTRYIVEAVESRLERILLEARYHDLIIMTAAHRHGLPRMFLGALSDSVVQNCQRPVMVVHTPEKKSEYFME